MTTPVKKYRLIKDCPYANKGTILTWNETDSCYDYISQHDDPYWYHKKYVENNPEWFEEIKEEQPITKEKAEVVGIYCISADAGKVVYEIHLNKLFPPDSGGKIKHLLEKYLSDGDIEGDGKGFYYCHGAKIPIGNPPTDKDTVKDKEQEGWEILTIYSNKDPFVMRGEREAIIQVVKDVYRGFICAPKLEDALKHSWSIHSVKRLSDNSTWEVKQLTAQGNISGFKIANDNCMEVYFEDVPFTHIPYILQELKPTKTPPTQSPIHKQENVLRYLRVIAVNDKDGRNLGYEIKVGNKDYRTNWNDDKEPILTHGVFDDPIDYQFSRIQVALQSMPNNNLQVDKDFAEMSKEDYWFTTFINQLPEVIWKNDREVRFIWGTIPVVGQISILPYHKEFKIIPYFHTDNIGAGNGMSIRIKFPRTI